VVVKAKTRTQKSSDPSSQPVQQGLADPLSDPLQSHELQDSLASTGGVIQRQIDASTMREFVQDQTRLQTALKTASDPEDVERIEYYEGTRRESLDDDMDDGDGSDGIEETESLDDLGDDHDWKQKRFTTVGFEHEFAGLETPNPLQDITHAELAKSTPPMPYTGLPFILETDSKSTLELVSPPFLLETLLNRPIPFPADVKKAEKLIRDSLKPLVARRISLEDMLEQYDTATGINLQLKNLSIKKRHMNLGAWKRRAPEEELEGDSLGELWVNRSTKYKKKTDYMGAQVSPRPKIASFCAGTADPVAAADATGRNQVRLSLISG